MSKPAPTYTIRDLALEFAVTARAIRHYEDLGLLAPERDGMQRIYRKRDRTRLKLIVRGKRLGLSLPDIKELIELYDTSPDQVPQLVTALAMIKRRRATLLQQRRDIDDVLAEIGDFEAQCQRLLAERRL